MDKTEFDTVVDSARADLSLAVAILSALTWPVTRHPLGTIARATVLAESAAKTLDRLLDTVPVESQPVDRMVAEDDAWSGQVTTSASSGAGGRIIATRP